MAVAPDRIRGLDLLPTTLNHFRGSNRQERLGAGQDLFRKVLLGRNDRGLLERAEHVLDQLGYSEGQRPLLTKILGLTNSGHSGTTETDGWRYRDSMDKRQVRGFVDLDSPLPKVVGIVAHVGREPSPEEVNAFHSILANPNSSEIARMYIFDSTYWNSSELVKVLTAESKRPPCGIHSKDHRLGKALYVPRAVGLVGVYSSYMEGRHDMVVDTDVPGEEKTHRKLRFVAEIDGVGLLVGASVDISQAA